MAGDVVRRRVVKRGHRKTAAVPAPPAPRIPRISRLMACAIVLQEMVERGEVRSYGEIACIAQVSRARLSQVTALNNLAPSIQEALLGLPPVGGSETVTERHLRPIAAARDWTDQWALWENLRL